MGNSTSQSASWKKHTSLLRADHMSQFQFKASKKKPVKVFPSFPHSHLRSTENGALLHVFGTVTGRKLTFSKLISFRNKRNKVLRSSYLNVSPIDDECKPTSGTADLDCNNYCNFVQFPNGNKLDDINGKENHCLRRHEMKNSPIAKDFDAAAPTFKTNFQPSREVRVPPHLKGERTNHSNDAKCVIEPIKPVSKRNIKKFYFGMEQKQSSLLYDKYSFRHLCKSVGLASSEDSCCKHNNELDVSSDIHHKRTAQLHKLSRALASKDRRCLEKASENGNMTFLESVKCVDGHEKSGDSGISGDTSSPWPVDYNRDKIVNSSTELHLSDYNRHYNGGDVSTDSSRWPSPVHLTPPEIQRCGALHRSAHFADNVRRVNENWLLVSNKCKKSCCNEESSDSFHPCPESKNSVITYDVSSKNPSDTKYRNELTSEGSDFRNGRLFSFQKKATSKKVHRLRKFKNPIFLSLPTLTECNQKCETPCETSNRQQYDKSCHARNHPHAKNARRLQAANPPAFESRSRNRHKFKSRSSKEDLSPTLFSSLSISSSSPDVGVCSKKNMRFRHEPVNYKDWTSLSILESRDFLDKRPASQPYSRVSRENLNVTSKNKVKYKSDSDGRPTPSRNLRAKKNILSYPEIVCDIPKVPYFFASDLKQRRQGVLRKKLTNYGGITTDDGLSTSEISTPSSRISGILKYGI